jgi:hypothetical protein
MQRKAGRDKGRKEKNAGPARNEILMAAAMQVRERERGRGGGGEREFVCCVCVCVNDRE